MKDLYYDNKKLPNGHMAIAFAPTVMIYACFLEYYNLIVQGGCCMPTPKIDPKYHSQLIKLGLNVAYYRKLANMTQEELAEQANVARNTITKIERTGVVQGMSLNTIFSISEALDVPLKDLFDFRDSSKE